MNDDEKRKTKSKKIARLMGQWDRSVRTAIQGSRKDEGLSQEAVAELMGWTADIVSNIEKGRRVITVPEFIVLAREMGVRK